MAKLPESTNKRWVTTSDTTYRNLRVACAALGVNYPKALYRRNKGWSVEQALEIHPPPGGGRGLKGQIYLVRHIESGKGYVGLTTTSIEKRWKRHLVSAANGKPVHSDSLQAAIIRYGEAAFTISVLDTADTIDELALLEQQGIDRFESMAPKGFNLKRGGAGLNRLGRPLVVEGTKYHALSDACSAHGLTLACVNGRLQRGESMDEAFSRPQARAFANAVEFNGKKYKSGSQLAAEYGVSESTYGRRRRYGASIPQCLGLELLPHRARSGRPTFNKSAQSAPAA